MSKSYSDLEQRALVVYLLVVLRMLMRVRVFIIASLHTRSSRLDHEAIFNARNMVTAAMRAVFVNVPVAY